MFAKYSLILLFLSTYSYVNAVKVKIPAGTVECISETLGAEHFAVPGGPRIDGRILVTGDSRYYLPFIHIQVLSPADDQIWQQQNVYSETHFNVGARGPGVYKVCFRNPWESRTDAIVDLVYFTLAHLRNGGAQLQVPKGTVEDRSLLIAHGDHVDQARQSVVGMSEFMQVISGSQRYLRRKLDRHMLTLESSRRRTLFYAWLEVCAILLVLLAQVLSIQRSFNGSAGFGEIRGPGVLGGGVRRPKLLV